MTQRIMVLGVPWSIHELTTAERAAERLGAQLHVVDTSDMLNAVDPSSTCQLTEVSTLDTDELVGVARSIAPDCVVSITELTMPHAARVREALKHPGTSAATEDLIADKYRTREVLGKHGLTGVSHWMTTIDEVGDLIRELPLPVVVKPLRLTGSAGVRMIDTPADVRKLLSQYDRETAVDFGRDRLLVETYVPGQEISVECLVVKGQLHMFALTEKINTGAPHFVEIGHLMPAARTAEWEPRVREYLEACVSALGVMTSPIHAELKLTDESVELIELHTRYGGDDIVHLLERSLGTSPFEVYFSAMLYGASPEEPDRPDDVWGIGFFASPVGAPFRWSSYDFPHPEAVVRLDVDTTARPKLRSYEGVRLSYWRAGHALFSSPKHEAVRESIDFMAARTPRAENLAEGGERT